MIYPIEIDIRYCNSDVNEEFNPEKAEDGSIRVKRVLNNGLQKLTCYVKEDGKSDDIHKESELHNGGTMLNLYDVIYEDVISEEPRRFPEATVIISRDV